MLFLIVSLLSFYAVVLLPIIFAICGYKLFRRLPKIHRRLRLFVAQTFLRRGLFRIWLVISCGWAMVCIYELVNLPGNCYTGSCDLFMRAFFRDTSSYYGLDFSWYNIAKALLEIPALASAVGIAVCWVIDGFRHSAAD
jgi:hypothetical protein